MWRKPLKHLLWRFCLLQMSCSGTEVQLSNHFVVTPDINAINRSSDVKTRKKYVAMVEKVKENAGNVKVFSSLHVSGESKHIAASLAVFTVALCSLIGLGQLSGVAAILRFPLPNLDESDEEDSKEHESTEQTK